MSKILILDIETSPAVVYVWKFFKENVAPKQVLEHPFIMSYAAKWLGDDHVYYEDNRDRNDKVLVTKLCALLDEADIVVAHNGDRFDLPKIRGRALANGIPPPSPVKTVDTCLVARKQFGFPSNSLEYLAQALGLKVQKGIHSKFPGFSLWAECLRGNAEAWEDMKKYNVKDILVLEELYICLRPWIVNHPNLAVYADEPQAPVCPKCGGTHLQYRGYAYTTTGKYHKLQCQTCFGWSRTRYGLTPKNENVLVHQVN